MNKLTGWRHFVRIRTILRASAKAVKHRVARKTPLPVKSADCLMVHLVIPGRRQRVRAKRGPMRRTRNPEVVRGAGFRVRAKTRAPE
jgi:hypothetical protein